MDGEWNKELLPHQGRHPYDYHDFVVEQMSKAARAAGRNKNEFLKQFDKLVKEPIRKNPYLLSKIGGK